MSPVVDWKKRAAALADALPITDPEWRRVFAATPRHLFVPRFYALDEFNAPRTPLDAANPEDRTRVLAAVYDDQVLITDYRTAGVHAGGTEIRVPTSSASLPSVVAVMLDRLNVTDGCTVLEIGTGTGYNAALLCARLGDRHVASVDINPELVELARVRLSEAGFHPRLATADGANGLPDAAPFDRIISTAAVSSIPPPWITQLDDEGMIVTPLSGARSGSLAVLTRSGPDTVQGRLDDVEVYFMPLRGAVDVPIRPGQPDGTPKASPIHRGVTEVDPRLLTDPDFLLWVELHLRGAQISLVDDDTTTVQVWTEAGSATAHLDPIRIEPPAWPVEQIGPQRPWDTVEAAWHAWRRAGRPERRRIGITASPDLQYAWLDDPNGAYCWPLPL